MAARGTEFFAFLCFSLCLAVPVSASTVSIMVIEAGLGEGIGVQESSAFWEYALMDAFFEGGHIVSNAPIARLAEFPAQDFPAIARADLNEAFSGGVEYFLVVLLDYRDAPALGGGLAVRNVSLRLFKTGSLVLLFEEGYSAPPSGFQKGEIAAVRNAAMAVMRVLAAAREENNAPASRIGAF